MILDSFCFSQVHTTHGRTPLMSACRADHDDVAELLLDQGVNVHVEDFEKATAIHLACEEGATDCVRILLKYGANINAQKKNGDTPIMLAAKRGNNVHFAGILITPNSALAKLLSCNKGKWQETEE